MTLKNIEDKKGKTANCIGCKFMEEHGYANKTYYCGHGGRADDMGKLGVGSLPGTSPAWCPKGKGAEKMVEFEDIKEKRLILSRYFIKQKDSNKKFGEKEVFYMWNNYFPGDFRIGQNQKFKLEKGKSVGHLTLPGSPNTPQSIIDEYNRKWVSCYYWILKYAHHNTLQKCDKDLYYLRRKQEKNLKKSCRAIKYGAKLGGQPKNKLADYHIFKKGFHRNGSFASNMAYIGKVKPKQSK